MITIHILPYIPREKGNQKIKFRLLTKYNARNISFKSQAKNEAGRLVPDLFLSFYKASNKGKASGHYLSLSLFW